MRELAGLAVDDDDVFELAGMLERAGYDETSRRLTDALKWDDDVVGLRIADRLAILDVLDGASEGLAGLHGVLVTEHRWRVRHRLV